MGIFGLRAVVKDGCVFICSSEVVHFLKFLDFLPIFVVGIVRVKKH